MIGQHRVSRRGFLGGVAGTLAVPAFGSPWRLLAQAGAGPQALVGAEAYDRYAKLAFNENPYGPPDSVAKAMTGALRYANRYGYPDGGLQEAIAALHGVTREHVLLGAGSGEILDVVGTTFLSGGRMVVGVEPSFGQVYDHARDVKGGALLLPLGKDFRQDIPAMIRAVRANARDVGFVYLCNPNNPTGLIVTRDEVRTLLDGIPGDIPVLIDEAYHHFVEDPGYATSVPHVLEGRPVIVTRTFSKIAALAGMRLGYAVAPPWLVNKMRPFTVGSINALVKWGGVAALQDTAAQEWVRRTTVDLRDRTVRALKAVGYECLPSQANFFMVHIKRPVQPVIAEFRKKGVLVGRPFPPMLEHLRVSVGTAEEMDRFVAAFKEIFA
jgi:histidinol-phosphate aminotransferase